LIVAVKENGFHEDHSMKADRHSIRGRGYKSNGAKADKPQPLTGRAARTIAAPLN
jgi:hypothetical protein